jgi:pimeloyl-ACP methyl ester carboxylesterase
MMAGPGIPGDSVVLLQQRLIALAGGASATRVDAMIAANRRLFQALKAAPDSAAAAANLQAARSEMLVDVPEPQRAPVGAQIDQGIKELEQPWMRYFLRYDPRPTLRKVRVPVLALGGTLDLQVPPEEDLTAIDAALKEGGNRDYRVVRLPGLNHLFQTATTGAPSEYEKIDETVSPSALELMAGWINQHFGR